MTVNCFGGKKPRLGKRPPCLALSPSTQTLGRRKEPPVRRCRAAQQTGHLIFGTIVGVALAVQAVKCFTPSSRASTGLGENWVRRNTT